MFELPVLGTLPVDWFSAGKMVLQFSLLVAFVYIVYNRFVKASQADRLLKGLFLVLMVFIGLWSLARLFDLPVLEVVFGASLQLLIIGLIVIFQPELRRILLYLGQADWFNLLGTIQPASNQDSASLVKELYEAARFLSKSKTGALIVLEKDPTASTSHGAYLEAGTALDAQVSVELLLTIFHTNTPLHDGAVVIDTNNRLAAAGVLLPLTEDPNLSWRYGTRHRAAIGLSEASGSSCIVVSEETGAISFVEQGQLNRMKNAAELREHLQALYAVADDELSQKRRNLWSRSFTPLREGADVLQTHLQSLLSFKAKGTQAAPPPPSKTASKAEKK